MLTRYGCGICVGFGQPTSGILTRVHGQVWGKIKILIKGKIDLRNEKCHTFKYYIRFVSFLLAFSSWSTFDASCFKPSREKLRIQVVVF